jgi:hypothetical protein
VVVHGVPPSEIFYSQAMAPRECFRLPLPRYFFDCGAGRGFLFVFKLCACVPNLGATTPPVASLDRGYKPLITGPVGVGLCGRTVVNKCLWCEEPTGAASHFGPGLWAKQPAPPGHVPAGGYIASISHRPCREAQREGQGVRHLRPPPRPTVRGTRGVGTQGVAPRQPERKDRTRGQDSDGPRRHHALFDSDDLLPRLKPPKPPRGTLRLGFCLFRACRGRLGRFSWLWGGFGRRG